MIIEELAYKVTVRTEEFLSGKKKVEEGAKDLGKNVSDAMGEAETSTKEIGTEVKKVGEQVRRTADDTKRPFGFISGGFFGAAKGAKEFGKQGTEALGGVVAGTAKFLGLALSIEGTRRLFESSTKNLVDLGNTSSNLDISARSLDGWKRAADAAGSSGEAMTSVLAKMKSAQNQFDSGMVNPDESTIAIRRLEGQTGVNVIGTGTPDEMFKNMEIALRKLPKSQAQTYAQMIGIDMSLFPSIQSGSLDRGQSKLEKNSNVNDQMIRTAREANEVMARLSQTTDSLGNALVLAFGPDIIAMMNIFDQWVRLNGGDVIDFFKDADKWVRQFSTALSGNKNAIHDWGQITDNFNLISGFDKPVVDLGGLIEKHGKGNKFYEWWNEIKDKDIFSSSNSDGSYDEEKLLDALMMAESNGNATVESPKGAVGAYQFMAGTARDMGLRVDESVDERKDPVKSREAARKYLNQLINKYNGNVDYALKAYNLGPGATDRWIGTGADPSKLNKETSNYVGRVSKYYGSDLSQVASLSNIPSGPQNTDNSQTSSTYINNVNLPTGAQNVDQLMDSILKQKQRSSMTGAFVSGNHK
ncbi:TPA: lytic transglycosylase domain-containing protein [Yersinia enterocolitica]|nr:lytic transglycosylase domain-containing protein [Yersinia enterocolitica]